MERTTLDTALRFGSGRAVRPSRSGVGTGHRGREWAAAADAPCEAVGVAGGSTHVGRAAGRCGREARATAVDEFTPRFGDEGGSAMDARGVGTLSALPVSSSSASTKRRESSAGSGGTAAVLSAAAAAVGASATSDDARAPGMSSVVSNGGQNRSPWEDVVASGEAVVEEEASASFRRNSSPCCGAGRPTGGVVWAGVSSLSPAQS